MRSTKRKEERDCLWTKKKKNKICKRIRAVSIQFKIQAIFMSSIFTVVLYIYLCMYIYIL